MELRNFLGNREQTLPLLRSLSALPRKERQVSMASGKMEQERFYTSFRRTDTRGHAQPSHAGLLADPDTSGLTDLKA